MRKFMKRFMLLLVIGMIAMFGVACGNSETATDEGADTSISTEVDSDVKEVLDDYETLADDYLEAADKYYEAAQSGDVSALTDLMTEYTDLQSEYQDTLSDIESMDYENFDEEDYDYYIDVTTRVAKKVEEALEKYEDLI